MGKRCEGPVPRATRRGACAPRWVAVSDGAVTSYDAIGRAVSIAQVVRARRDGVR
jgi:hypothetical protein